MSVWYAHTWRTNAFKVNRLYKCVQSRWGEITDISVSHEGLCSQTGRKKNAACWIWWMWFVFSKHLPETTSLARELFIKTRSVKRAVYSIILVKLACIICRQRPPVHTAALPVCFPASSSPQSQHILQSQPQSTIHSSEVRARPMCFH